MQDPVGAFYTIKDNYLRYIRTAFSTRFPAINAERDALLEQDKVFYREPWVEALPEYTSSGKTVDGLAAEDLPKLSDPAITLFKGLTKTGLFPAGQSLYEHQRDMLARALESENCVITSGTGSGKTESFLLPIFAQIAKEMPGWSPPHAKNPLQDGWWETATPTQIADRNNGYALAPDVQQRGHETRPAAVRALILYPMNALVEDQMTRLRKALDSDESRQWLAQNANGNCVYFGRYNSNSPVAGELRKVRADGTAEMNKPKIEALKEALKEIAKQAERVKKHLLNNPGLPADEQKDLIAFFQRLDGAEMRCRFDMQLAPPDLLITNFSMLAVMLMREVDAPIFEKNPRLARCRRPARNPARRCPQRPHLSPCSGRTTLVSRHTRHRGRLSDAALAPATRPASGPPAVAHIGFVSLTRRRRRQERPVLARLFRRGAKTLFHHPRRRKLGGWIA